MNDQKRTNIHAAEGRAERRHPGDSLTPPIFPDGDVYF